jgi:hypothetical protein
MPAALLREARPLAGGGATEEGAHTPMVTGGGGAGEGPARPAARSRSTPVLAEGV